MAAGDHRHVCFDQWCLAVLPEIPPLNLFQEWWQEMAAGGGVIGTAATYVTAVVRKVNRIDREKADKSEVVRMFDLMEKRLEKRDDEFKQSLSGLHRKFDEFAAAQHEINRDMARVAGRINGRHDG